MVVGDVYSVDWIFCWRGCPSIPRPATCDEYVPSRPERYLELTAVIPVWPANLVTAAVFNTLHSQQYAGAGNRGGISRERFFAYALCASAVWYIVPGYLFQGLSVFGWVTWFAPNNVIVNQLFGVNTGLGMGLLTFDWAQVSTLQFPSLCAAR